MNERAAQFDTNAPAVSELPSPEAAIWRFKVTAVDPGGNTTLLKCKACNYSGGAISVREYIVRKSFAHVVDDLIFAAMPRGGSGQVYNNRPVDWVELNISLPSPTARYQLLMPIDDNFTLMWDRLRVSD